MPSLSSDALIDAWNASQFEKFNIKSSHRLSTGQLPGGVIRLDPTLAIVPQHLPANLRIDAYEPLGVAFVHRCGRQGVLLSELLSRSAHGVGEVLSGAAELVMSPRVQAIRLHICWPGMQRQMDFVRHVPMVASNGAPFTRAQVGHQIAKVFHEWYRMLASHYKLNRNEPMRPPWDPRVITFEMLLLLSVCHLNGDEWQAEVAIPKK